MGVDFFQSDLNLTDVIAQRIQEFIMGIQQRIAACSNSVFCINIENNLIFGAANVKKYFALHRMPIANNILFICEEASKQPRTTVEGQAVIRAGSNTNTHTKPLMVEKLKRIIRGKTLKVHKQCVQMCLGDMPEHLEGKKSIDVLVNQLNGMVMDLQRPDAAAKNSLIKRPYVIYRPESGADNDDSFMALLISIDTQRRALEEINVQRRGR